MDYHIENNKCKGYSCKHFNFCNWKNNLHYQKCNEVICKKSKKCYVFSNELYHTFDYYNNKCLYYYIVELLNLNKNKFKLNIFYLLFFKIYFVKNKSKSKITDFILSYIDQISHYNEYIFNDISKTAKNVSNLNNLLSYCINKNVDVTKTLPFNEKTKDCFNMGMSTVGLTKEKSDYLTMIDEMNYNNHHMNCDDFKYDPVKISDVSKFESSSEYEIYNLNSSNSEENLDFQISSEDSSKEVDIYLEGLEFTNISDFIERIENMNIEDIYQNKKILNFLRFNL